MIEIMPARVHALLLLTLLGACRDHRVIQPTLALPRPGEPVPAFAFALRDGARFASSDLRGRPTVLFLWSTHCPTSRQAIAEYRQLRDRYADRAAIVLLSDDATDAELALLPAVLADSGIGGPVALAHGTLATVFDRSRTAPERDTARVEFVLPAYVVLDSTGIVRTRSRGPDAGLVRLVLDSLLAARLARITDADQSSGPFRRVIRWQGGSLVSSIPDGVSPYPLSFPIRHPFMFSDYYYSRRAGPRPVY
jgi:peroxiredoxin